MVSKSLPSKVSDSTGNKNKEKSKHESGSENDEDSQAGSTETEYLEEAEFKKFKKTIETELKQKDKQISDLNAAC